MKPDASDVVVFLGIVLIGLGVYRIDPGMIPLYLIALGVLFVALGVLAIAKDTRNGLTAMQALRRKIRNYTE